MNRKIFPAVPRATTEYGLSVLHHDLWDLHKLGYIIGITINLGVKKNGENVMGCGCAKEAAQRFPSLPRLVGESNQVLWNEHPNLKQQIKKDMWDEQMMRSCCSFYPRLRLFTFPVKYDWNQPADTCLIQYSAWWLDLMVRAWEDYTIYLPKPGCGAGGLSWEKVAKSLRHYRVKNLIFVDYPKGKE